MIYSGTRVLTNDDELVFVISEFKNPVNMNEKSGFRITVQDSQGYLVDQSDSDLPLNTEMTEVGTLDAKEVLMLGDSNGQNIGRVFEYN